MRDTSKPAATKTGEPPVSTGDKATKPRATDADPVRALIAALSDEAGNEASRKQARGGVSAIAMSGRPWEQLPSGLKAAARSDARALAAGTGDNTALLVDAGYHPSAASRLLRDIGAV
jgi:hypothetical protein